MNETRVSPSARMCACVCKKKGEILELYNFIVFFVARTGNEVLQSGENFLEDTGGTFFFFICARRDRR